MTYLKFITKCLSFFKNQKEEFDKLDFYFFWLSNRDIDVDSYYKERVKLAIMYLILNEAGENIKVDNRVIKFIEKELSFFCPSLTKTIEKVEETIMEDPYMLDELSLLDQGLLTDEELHKFMKKCFSKFEENISDEYEIESPIHGIIEMVSQIIPELFFTEKGYRYIDEEFQIEDIEFRKLCYNYIKDSIKYYNDHRIYRIDKKLYDEMYEYDEDEYEVQEEFTNDENLNYSLISDELRGEINIYGEDIDNLDILYYSVTLLFIMLRFIKNKQYDKIQKMIEIDDVMTNSYDGYSLNYEKTLIETLYQPKSMACDLQEEISMPQKCDFYLDFFLSNNSFTEQYSIKQLSLIISCCFDYFSNNPIKDLVDNNNMIIKIFETTNINDEQDNMKKLIKVKGN